MVLKQLREKLGSGGLDDALGSLYADLPAARDRCLAVLTGWQETFGGGEDREVKLVSAPGRTELGGNHTDHQHGRVLCGSVDLDVLACVGANGLEEIRVYSRGYGMARVSLGDPEPVTEERGTSAALIRGVAAGMVRIGIPVRGMDVYVDSAVPVGSGVDAVVDVTAAQEGVVLAMGGDECVVGGKLGHDFSHEAAVLNAGAVVGEGADMGKQLVETGGFLTLTLHRQAADGGDVDAGVALDELKLRTQRLVTVGSGIEVGHGADCGHAAVSGSQGTGADGFLIRKTGLSQMRMDISKTRYNAKTRRRKHHVRGSGGEGIANSNNSAIRDRDVRTTKTTLHKHLSAGKEQSLRGGQHVVSPFVPAIYYGLFIISFIIREKSHQVKRGCQQKRNGKVWVSIHSEQPQIDSYF